jgi:hypothetical protein
MGRYDPAGIGLLMRPDGRIGNPIPPGHVLVPDVIEIKEALMAGRVANRPDGEPQQVRMPFLRWETYHFKWKVPQTI